MPQTTAGEIMPFGRKVSGAFMVVFLFTGLSLGQSGASIPAAGTRADLWKKAKLQKQQTSTPLKLGLIERLFASAEKGAFSISPAGIHPTVGTVTTGSGPSFGARFGLYDMGGLPLDFSIEGEASTRMYQGYSLQLGEQSSRDTTFTLQPLSRRLTTEFDEGPLKKDPGRTLFLDVNFHYFPQEDFYGIGPGSNRQDVSDYLYQCLSIEGVGGVQFTKWLGWSLRGGLLAEVPFYLMESLGGSNSLRGFPEYRFRDRNLLLMSAEYRWDAAEFLEMALFYDTGKVFSRPGDFDFTGLEKGYGGGLRIKRSGTIFLRLELGHSREGNQVHFRLGPSF